MTTPAALRQQHHVRFAYHIINGPSVRAQSEKAYQMAHMQNMSFPAQVFPSHHEGYIVVIMNMAGTLPHSFQEARAFVEPVTLPAQILNPHYQPLDFWQLRDSGIIDLDWTDVKVYQSSAQPTTVDPREDVYYIGHGLFTDKLPNLPLSCKAPFTAATKKAFMKARTQTFPYFHPYFFWNPAICRLVLLAPLEQYIPGLPKNWAAQQREEDLAVCRQLKNSKQYYFL